MTLDFTVAIPTYNGASRLPKVLESLRLQVNSEQIRWEIIVVDNNSNDNTAEIIRDYQANWLSNIPLRYCFERRQGLAAARARAIREARGKFVGFIDDDNLPDADWISAAYSFGQSHPKAGAYGGQVHGDFEVNPPENFQIIQSFLAIRERGETPHLYDPDNLSLPPGAALVVRRKAWCQNVPSRLRLSGRVNGSMLGGEDYEALLYIYRAGWEIWYNPAMHTYHQIPQYRLEKDYLLSLICGSSLCICYLRMLNVEDWNKPIIFSKILLGSTLRMVRHLIKYRGQVKTDLIAACEMQFFWSSFLSSFYYIFINLAELYCQILATKKALKTNIFEYYTNLK